MATIVQPYNPWREQLAVTALGKVAGDIIGDIWKTHKQNEQNRKANAFRGQLQQELGNIAQQGNISLAQPQAPEGYNSNPWASAFHQNNSPLTQFDIGTSQRQPTIQDIANIADNLAATPRFSALSPEVMQGVKNSMIQMAENKRLQDLQNNYIDMFRNATNPTDMFRAITMGTAQGAMPKEAMQYFSPWAVAQTPQYQEVNAGDKIFATVFSPFTGEVTPKAAYNVGINPSEKYKADSLASSSRYATDTNFKAEQIRGQSAAEAARYKFMSDMLENYNKNIDNEITKLEAQRESAPDEKSAVYFQQQIDALTQQKKQYNDAFMSSFGLGGTQAAGTATAQTGQNTGSSNNVWFGMVGNPKGISVHPHGTFGYDRGTHKHAGIDIPVVEGTDIKTMPEMGSTFTVKEARNHKSYGNTVVIESDRKFNGKTVQFRIAHMQDGSLNLKPGQVIKAGDIIGKVGSTGRSTGAHVHLEVIVDGQKVDPQTFFQNFSAQTQNTPQVTATGNLKTQPQNTQNAKSTAQGNQGGIPYLVKDGDMLTLEAFDKIREQGNYDPETLFNILTEQKGWQLATPQSTPKVTAINQQTPQNTANTEPVTQTNQAPPQNRPFSLPGRPQYPQGWTFSDVINWINSVKNNENPFAKPDIPTENTPINSVPPEPVSTGANPYNYLLKEAPINIQSSTFHDSYSENTARPPVSALGGISPLSGDILNFGDDVIPQWAVLNDPFYYTKYKYGRYGR